MIEMRIILFTWILTTKHTTTNEAPTSLHGAKMQSTFDTQEIGDTTDTQGIKNTINLRAEALAGSTKYSRNYWRRDHYLILNKLEAQALSHNLVSISAGHLEMQSILNNTLQDK